MDASGNRSGTDTTSGSAAATRRGGGDVLVPILDDGVNERVLGVAAALARNRNGGLLVMKVVPLPRVLPFDAYDEDESSDRDREALRSALQATSALRVPTRGIVRVGRNTAAMVLHAIETHRIDAVVLEYPGLPGSIGLFRRRPIDRIVADAECDVLVVRGGSDRPDVRSVLLPIAGWPYARFTAEVAAALAAEHGSTVDVVHVVGTGASERVHEQVWDDLSACLCHLDGLDVTVRVPEGKHVASTIVARASEYDLAVLGAPRTKLLRALLGRSIPRIVSQRTRTTVLMARTTSTATGT